MNINQKFVFSSTNIKTKNDSNIHFNRIKNNHINKSIKHDGKINKTILTKGKTSSQHGCEDVSCACLVF